MSPVERVKILMQTMDSIHVLLAEKLNLIAALLTVSDVLAKNKELPLSGEETWLIVFDMLLNKVLLWLLMISSKLSSQEKIKTLNWYVSFQQFDVWRIRRCHCYGYLLSIGFRSYSSCF